MLFFFKSGRSLGAGAVKPKIVDFDETFSKKLVCVVLSKKQVSQSEYGKYFKNVPFSII